MADSKITDLTAKTVLDGTEELVANDSATDKKIGVDNLATGLPLFMPRLDFSTGRKYFPYTHSTTSTLVTTLDRMYAAPIIIPTRTTFTRIGIFIDTGNATAVVRLGIYAMGADGLPGALVLDAGTVDAATSGDKTITISEELYGTYYLVAASQTATCTVKAGLSSERVFGFGNLYGVAAGDDSPPNSIYVASVSGALPDPAGTIVYVAAGAQPAPYLQVV